MNYTEAEFIKLGRSVSSAASRWLDPMTQQLNASKYELCKQEYLPEISYQSGGLENAAIRRQVCEILEGGEAAFKERAKRLRVRI
jgi:hypothetical protein